MFRSLLPASVVALVAVFGVLSAADQARKASVPNPNPNIDMNAYLKVSLEAAQHRESRRLPEEDFLRLSQEPATLVLDARSKEKFDLLHIKGAVNLSFPDIDVESLKKTIPDKNTRVLIYCNNNFRNEGNEVARAAFPTKKISASLNLSTYIALYNYGYRNIYELGPQLDPATTKLPFESNIKK